MNDFELSQDEELLQDENEIVVTADESGERIDVFSAKASGETRNFVQKLIDNNCVLVNGKTCKNNYKLKKGDEVRITIPAPVQTELVAQNIPIDIVYQDKDIVVVNKEKGMVVHPAPGNPDGTLVNAIMYHVDELSGIGGELRPGIVHRIDKMTSGLIVIAKNDMAHRALAEQMKTHEAHRTYYALVEGNIKEDTGTVDAPIFRHPTDRKKMAIVKGGREAITHYEVVERFGDFTLIRAKLETGRTHQIRVHMASIKHPVAGDTVYGSQKPKLGLDGQALHAYELTITHPRTGEKMTFNAPMPEYFKQALEKLRNRKQ